MRNLIYISLIIVIGMTSCYYDNEQDLYPNNTVVLPEVVTFTDQIQPIMTENCAIPSCHVSGTGLPLVDDYQSAKTLGEAGKLGNRVVDQMTMPPSGPLLPTEIQLIDKWINTGFNQ